MGARAFRLDRNGSKIRTGAIIATAVIVILSVTHWDVRTARRLSDPRKSSALAKGVSRSSTQPKKKVILFWNKWFHLAHPDFVLDVSACPVNNCLVTQDRRKMKDSSAFIFHIAGGDLSASDLPANRQPEHLYVFYAYEAPYNTADVRNKPWPGFFNLTWTYRRDSDIFGDYYARDFHFTSWDESAMEAKRTLDRGIALISHCDTPGGRERYLKELNKYFPVDIFGGCGKSTPCKLIYRFSDCERDLVQKYKFYFAFENSICKDYITEKAIRPLTYGSVPVVFGAGPYNAILPAGSFINAEDFKSPRELGEFLSSLSRNPKMYKKFFDWRANWTESRILHDPKASSICKLCEILNDDTFPGRVYNDIDGWWRREAHCRVWNK